MSNHRHNGGILPPETDPEREKFAALGASYHSDSGDQLLESCRCAAKRLKTLRKQARRAKYERLATVYELLCAAFANPKVMKRVDREAKEQAIAVSARTSKALLFVKVCCGARIEPATASQQAMALRGAALLAIKPRNFAEHLVKHGGITNLAAHFKTTLEQARSRAERPLSLRSPALKWSGGTLAKWKRLAQGHARVRIIVTTDGPVGGTVVAVKGSASKHGGAA